MAINATALYPTKCMNCGGQLLWNSDANLEDVYGVQMENVEGHVAFHSCTNPECDLMYEVGYFYESNEVSIRVLGEEE